MTGLALDHLVVAAASLAQGVAWCEATLGVVPGPGGLHRLMGTHNRLLKIASADFPRAYLEIIAIDPEAPLPGRARWFGLDDPALQARLRTSPRLVHLVARSTQLEHHRRCLLDLGQQPGEPVRASRQTPQGLLSWQMVLRPDGRLEAGGALPTLIQWEGTHPADSMADAGVRLLALHARGLSPPVQDLLRLPGVNLTVSDGPALSATLSTPIGNVSLETP